MKHLLITAAIALLASTAGPASAQATKTRKTPDTQQMQDTMKHRTAPARPMRPDTTNKYPNDSIPNKNINGR